MLDTEDKAETFLKTFFKKEAFDKSVFIILDDKFKALGVNEQQVNERSINYKELISAVLALNGSIVIGTFNKVHFNEAYKGDFIKKFQPIEKVLNIKVLDTFYI